MLGDPDRAEREYETALKVQWGAKDGSDVRGLNGMIANNLALNRLRRDDWAGAKRYFQIALMFDPKSIEAMNNLGMWYARFGKEKVAMFWFERAITLNPEFSPAWENLKKIEER
jgi:Tfp pilus assembly protein PilF